MEVQEQYGFLRKQLHQPVFSSTEEEAVIACAFDQSAERIVVLLSVGELLCRSLKSGEQLWSVGGSQVSNNALALSSDKRLAAFGTEDGAVVIVSVDDGSVCGRFRGEKASITDIAFHPREPVVAVAAGKRLLVLDQQGVVLEEFPESPTVLTSLAWSPDGERLASSASGVVRLLRRGQKVPIRVFEYPTPMLRLQWSPSGSFLVCGCQDETIRFWKFPEAEFFQMTGYAAKVKGLSFSSQGDLLITTGSLDVACWDFSGGGPAGKPPRVFRLHQDLLAQVSFAPTASRFVSTSKEGSVGFWDVENEKPLAAAFIDHEPLCLAWSDDGVIVAIGNAGGELLVFLAPK